ncbi:hypothetical protein EDD85DRAFT_843375 [Armillaria nabsnona]|nr:hypothetical protein EDD85DRAFT_843375 [Armillaria nabsnona]
MYLIMTKYLIPYLFPLLQCSFSIAMSPLRLRSMLWAYTTTSAGKLCSLGCKQYLLNSNLQSYPSFCHPVSVATMNRVTVA